MPTCPFCSKSVPENSSVCPHCLRAQPLTVPTASRAAGNSAGSSYRTRLIALVAAVLVLGVYAVRERGTIADSLPSREPAAAEVTPPPPPIPDARPTMAVPIELRIADSAAAVVAPGSYLAFPFSGEDRTGCHVTGTVRSLKGGRVDVFVVDGMGADDLANGRSPRRYYDSGTTASATLNARLDGRSHYSLIVANRGAPSRARTVKLSVGARCTD
jgi:hypothetical protein